MRLKAHRSRAREMAERARREYADADETSAADTVRAWLDEPSRSLSRTPDAARG
jgi:hypothetical protein